MPHMTQNDGLKDIRNRLGRYATLIEYAKVGTIRDSLEITVFITDDRLEFDGGITTTRRITVFDGNKRIVQDVLATTTFRKGKAPA